MNSLPQVATPEFTDRISTWGNTAVNGRPLNLRNLGPDHTLLLIDGHRVADYPMPSGGQSTFQNYNTMWGPGHHNGRVPVATFAASRFGAMVLKQTRGRGVMPFVIELRDVPTELSSRRRPE